ncbi:unnamed protein product [Clonostachys rhizophaga]|uniref:Rhodopsin domain-containing protein n=1 Tax=Clonostachys rhizophaga TaxID=160324 RepID=A0A9N9V3N9_9HYPO|nr:unnamed protein product [Clonostachys rhizophaga]
MKDFGLISTEKMVFASKLDYYFLIFMCPCLGLIKTSFLFLYKRIFTSEYSSAWNHTLNAAIAFTLLWTVAFFGAHIFECGTHFYAIWGDAESYLEYCTRIPQLVFAFCLTDLLTNLIIALIPIPLIWGSELKLGKIIATAGVFALGIVSVAASIVRLRMSVEAAGFSLSGSKSQDLPTMSNGTSQAGDDVFLTIALHLYWAIVECGVGIVAASLPALAFFMHPLSLLFTGQYKYAHHSAFVSNADSAGGRTPMAGTPRCTTARSGEKRFGDGLEGHWRSGSSGSDDTAVNLDKDIEAGMCEKWIGVQLDKFMEANEGAHRIDRPFTPTERRPSTARTHVGSEEYPDQPPEAHIARRESKFQEIWWK